MTKLADRRQYYKEWRQNNKERKKNSDREYHIKNREKRVEYSKNYNGPYYLENRERILENGRKNYLVEKAEREEHEISKRNYRMRRTQRESAMRTILINLLGGPICKKCGYDNDIRALEIDHIHDDGNTDRMRFKSQYDSIKYYTDNPIEAMEKLQILCCNCNTIKMHEFRRLKECVVVQNN